MLDRLVRALTVLAVVVAGVLAVALGIRGSLVAIPAVIVLVLAVAAWDDMDRLLR